MIFEHCVASFPSIFDAVISIDDAENWLKNDASKKNRIFVTDWWVLAVSCIIICEHLCRLMGLIVSVWVWWVQLVNKQRREKHLREKWSVVQFKFRLEKGPQTNGRLNYSADHIAQHTVSYSLCWHIVLCVT